MPARAKKTHTSRKQKHWLHLRPVHVLFSLLVLGLLLGVSAFFTLNKPIQYDGLKTVETKNYQLSISLPSAMEENYISEKIIDFSHSHNGAEDVLSHARVEAQYVDADLLKQEKPQIQRQFLKGEGQFFEAFTRQPLTQPDAANLMFGKFKSYSSDNLDKALVGGFSYSSGEALVSGRLLLAFGESEIYLAVVEATNEVWQHNLLVWDEVFASLELEDGR